MKPQSCKAKGRRHQQKIVADLYDTFPELEEGDLRSTSMGANGEDIQMSAAARKLIPFSIEAKNTERLNIWNAFDQCKSNCGSHNPALVIKKNHSDMLCVLKWSAFLELLQSKETKEVKEEENNSDRSEKPLHEQLREIANELEQNSKLQDKKRKFSENFDQQDQNQCPGASIFESE